MNDKAFLLHVLADGREHSLQEILRRSFEERGHGLTVHSRAADARKDGHNIIVTAGVRGGIYRLALEATSGSPVDGGGSEPEVASSALDAADRARVDPPAVRSAASSAFACAAADPPVADALDISARTDRASGRGERGRADQLTLDVAAA